MTGSSDVYISENILHPCFVKCFAPIHIVQLVIGSIHADIRDGFIMPTTRSQKLYTMVWFLLCSYSSYHFINFYFTEYYSVNKALGICLALGAMLQFATYVINVFHASFSNGEKTCNIYLEIQKIDGMLNISELLHFNQELYRYNCFMVFGLITIYIPGYLIYIFVCIDDGGRAICMGFGYVIVYMEIILTGNLIYYLGTRVKYVNGVIKMNIVFVKENHNLVNDMDVETWDIKDFEMISEFENENSNTLDLEKFFVCIDVILKTYQDINQRFCMPVFLITSTVYLWSFLIIDGVVVGLSTGLLPWLAVVTITLWVIFYYVQLVLLAVINDWFCHQVQQLKLVCIYALSVYQEGPVVSAAKNLMRLVEQKQPQFSVWGVWALTRALPLNLLTLITHNVVLLLQFLL